MVFVFFSINLISKCDSLNICIQRAIFLDKFFSVLFSIFCYFYVFRLILDPQKSTKKINYEFKRNKIKIFSIFKSIQ